MKTMANGKIVLLISVLMVMTLFPIHNARAADTTPPQVNNCTQQKSVVESLGINIFHSTKGHNFLHGEFSDDTGLDYVYVECSLDNGSTWQAMKYYPSSSFYTNLTELNNWTAPNGARESFAVTRISNGTYIGMYGDNLAVANQAFHRMWSPDAIHFYNDTVVINESDKDEDINLIWINGTLYDYDEDDISYGLGIHKSTDDGVTWTELEDNFDPFSIEPMSPFPFIWNDVLYVTGESHLNASAWGYTMVSNGINPTNFTNYSYTGNISAHSELDHHFAITAMWIDKNGTCHAFLDTELTNGSWGHYYVETTNITPYPHEPWTLIHFFPSTGTQNPHNVLRVFNGFYFYSITDSHTKIRVLQPQGVIEKHYFNNATSGNWTYEFYEPSLPNGTTVAWRFVVVDTAGNTNYSETYNFTIGESSESSSTISDTESFGYFYRIVYSAPSPPPATASDTESFGYFYRIIYSNATNNGSGFVISHSYDYFYIAASLVVFFPILGFIIYKWRLK